MKNFLFLIPLISLLGVGCSNTPATNSVLNDQPPRTTTSTPNAADPNPAGAYSGFSKVSFGRMGGNIKPYTITLLSPGVTPNTENENGKIISDYPSSCIKKDEKITMEQLIALDGYFGRPTFWSLPDIIGSHLPNPDRASLFIEIASDAGKKKIILASGTNELFDTIFKMLLSTAAKPGCTF